MKPANIEAPPGIMACSMCKAPKEQRKFMFVNEPQDCAVCDQCTALLFEKLSQLVLTDQASPNAKAN
jgi:hypothetical protein